MQISAGNIENLANFMHFLKVEIMNENMCNNVKKSNNIGKNVENCQFFNAYFV